MDDQFTFGMLKPDIVSNNLVGEVLDIIEKKGFVISALKKVQLTKNEAEQFYIMHTEQPFFKRLIDFMTSGPVVAMVLKKDNSVKDFRRLMGATDPEKSKEGTIRKKYAKSITINAIHGSDSNENAHLESSFFFSKMDQV